MTPAKIRARFHPGQEAPLGPCQEKAAEAKSHELHHRQPTVPPSELKLRAAARILSEECRGFGPRLAREYLAKNHQIYIGWKTLRAAMAKAGLLAARRPQAEAPVERHARRGDSVQWRTLKRDWLDGRGEKLSLLHMLDNATGELTARFVPRDSVEENFRLLKSYLERHSRPACFRGKVGRNTQISRALEELGIGWAPVSLAPGENHQQYNLDALARGLRLAGVEDLDEANRYLGQDFLPWWDQHVTMQPDDPADAHRPLAAGHDLDSILSLVDHRQVSDDSTVRFQGKLYQIAARPGSRVRVEIRLDGSIWIRVGERSSVAEECQSQAKVTAPMPKRARRTREKPGEAWRATQGRIASGGAPVWRAAQIDRARID